MSPLVAISRELAARCERLRFGPPVAYVYHPLVYARAPHEVYLERYGTAAPREVIFVGMNPGPFGMAQTGVPFGDVAMVRDWLGVHGEVGTPRRMHPRRPIEGFASRRAEVSGTRFWGWARDRYGTPERFFARFYVTNWCPLAFVETSGRNLTPDKLPVELREPLFSLCDEALAAIVAHLRPRWVIGVGAFAAQRARKALEGRAPGVQIASILHPSPASPAANGNWAAAVDAQLRALGLEPPLLQPSVAAR